MVSPLLTFVAGAFTVGVWAGAALGVVCLVAETALRGHRQLRRARESWQAGR